MITAKEIEIVKAKVWDAEFRANSDCFPVDIGKVENPKACRESKATLVKLKTELSQMQTAYVTQPKNIPLQQGGNQVGSIISLFPLFFFGFVFVAIIRKNRKSAIQAKSTYDRSKKEIKDLQVSGTMIVVTTDTVPGREIECVLGVVTGMSNEIASDVEAEADEHKAMLNMMNAAAERGANAVVGFRSSSSSYEERGSKWMKSKIICNGTAIRLRC